MRLLIKSATGAVLQDHDQYTDKKVTMYEPGKGNKQLPFHRIAPKEYAHLL